MKSLYDRLKSAGCELDSHESDLYVRATPEARRIIKEYEAETGWTLSASGFTHQVKKEFWLDVPFMFSPWWEVRLTSGGR